MNIMPVACDCAIMITVLTIIVGHIHSCIHTKALKYHKVHFK